jgi:hypothetical protein
MIWTDIKCNYSCTSSIMGHPHTSLNMLWSTWMNSPRPNEWLWWSPQKWPTWSPDFTELDFRVWGCMKNMVYECKVNRRDKLLHWIFDAERHKNDPDVPLKVQILNFNFQKLCNRWELDPCSWHFWLGMMPEIRPWTPYITFSTMFMRPRLTAVEWCIPFLSTQSSN